MTTPLSYKRNPIKARRHYDQVEAETVMSNPVEKTCRVTGRPHLGVEIKANRLAKNLRTLHERDGSWKYKAQEFSKRYADRDGLPWEKWETDWLETSYGAGYDALAQALHLKRTYRAVEDKRKRLWRMMDKKLAQELCQGV